MFVVPYFVRADHMRGRLVAELDAVRTSLGPEIGNNLIQTANRGYDLTVVRSGLRAAMDDLRQSSSDRENTSRVGSAVLSAATDAVEGYFQSLAMQMYAMILRGTIVAVWLLMLLPFVLAVLVDGLMARSKKFELLGYQNPTAFAAGTHLVVLISVLPLLYIVAPFALSPLFMPYWAAAAALPLSFAIRHMQPILTR